MPEENYEFTSARRLMQVAGIEARSGEIKRLSN
jgi:hypothetical protein